MVQINDSSVVPPLVSNEFSLSWHHRDRVLQADQLVDASMGSIGPEPGTTYTARVHLNGVLVETVAGIAGGTLENYSYAGDGLMRIDVAAVCNGLESWQAASSPAFNYRGALALSGTLPAAIVGGAYSAGLTATGGNPPYHWTLGAGAPAGLVIDPDAGLITGAATTVGDYAFDVTVEDASLKTATSSQTINVSVGDPFWSDVITLLSFDGPNGSKNILDKTGKIWSVIGDAAISTAQSKFGESSLRLGRYTAGSTTVSTALIQRPGIAADNFGTGSFCIEGWGFIASDAPIGDSPTLISKRFDWTLSGRGWIEIWLSSSGQLEVGLAANHNSWGVRLSSSASIPKGAQWSFALDRSGADVRLFLNGSIVASAVWAASLYSETSDPLRIGADPGSNGLGSNFWPGFLDEIRITRHSRYTANYTPSLVPFPSQG